MLGVSAFGVLGVLLQSATEEILEPIAFIIATFYPRRLGFEQGFETSSAQCLRV